MNESAAGSTGLDVSMIDGENHVVNVSGELDVRTRQFVEQACLAGDDVAVVVEMAELTFMDCCGYAGLVAVRRVLQEHGGSLTLTQSRSVNRHACWRCSGSRTARPVEQNGATMS